MAFVLGAVRRFPFIVLIVALGVGGFFFREHLTGAAADLRVGDCFDHPAEVEEIVDVQHRPCTDPHDAEVFLLVSHQAPKGASYPSADTFTDLAIDSCVPAFEAYTGSNFDRLPDVDISWHYPTPGSWDDGDRGITCFLVNVNGAKLSSSLRAAQ